MMRNVMVLLRNGKYTHPIFNTYTLDVIAEMTGYHRETLSQVRRGHLPVSRKLRKVASLAFGLPEDELFTTNGTSNGRA